MAPPGNQGIAEPVVDPDGSIEGFIPTSDGAYVVGEPQGSPGWYPANEGLTALANGVLVSTSTANDRGAMTIHALRGKMGDMAFFQFARGWAQDNRYGKVDTADFIAAAEEASGRTWTRSSTSGSSSRASRPAGNREERVPSSRAAPSPR